MSNIINDFAAELLVILLVGPKGSGKSHIGQTVSELFGLRFIRVEAIWQDVRNEKPEYSEPDYLKSAEYTGTVMNRCFFEVRRSLAEHRSAVIETTGLFDFDDYLARLKSIARVVLVNVRAGMQSCAARIKLRDQSLQIPVTEDDVRNMNVRSSALSYPWDIVITNDPFLSNQQIEDAFRPHLQLIRS